MPSAITLQPCEGVKIVHIFHQKLEHTYPKLKKFWYQIWEDERDFMNL